MPLKKLNPEELDTTDKLIHAIEHKDRRFRLFQTIFMVGTFLALIIIIGGQQNTLDGIRAQQTEAKDQAKAQDKQSNELGARIERRLDCMVVFFSQKERTNLSIENIDKCTLNRDGDIQRFFRDDPDRGTVTTPTEQPSSLTPSTAPQTGDSAAEEPIEQPPVVEPRPPVVIDLPLLPSIPVCVPFTGICVVQ